MLNIALKNIKEITRDKKILVTSFLFPVLLLVISQFLSKHTNTFTENLPLAVVNPEPNFPKAGRLLVVALTRAVSSNTGVRLYEIEEIGRHEAAQKLEQGQVVGVLLIPKGFTERLHSRKPEKLSLILNANDRRAGILAGSLHAIVGRFGELVEKSFRTNRENTVSLSTLESGESSLTSENESLANVTLFAFLFLIPFAAGQWISEFERGSWMRFRLSQTSPKALFGGVFAATAALGMIQSALLLAAAFFLKLHPYLLVMWIWPLSLFFALAAAGLGSMLAAIVEKEKQQNLLSSLILIPLFLVSGSLGRQIFIGRWGTILPWSEGYTILSDTLRTKTPEPMALAALLGSSLALAAFGTLVFSIKRFRYE